MTIPAGFAQVNWFFSGSAVPTGAQVTLGLDVSEDTGTPAEQAEFLWDVWRDELLPRQTGQLVLEGCLVKQGPDATGPSARFDAVANGLAAGEPAGPQMALLVQKRTVDGGRAGKGRMYIPGLTEGQVDTGGAIDNGELLLWQEAVDAFVARLDAVIMGPVVLHSAGSPLSSPSPITTLSVQGVAATQRLRQRR